MEPWARGSPVALAQTGRSKAEADTLLADVVRAGGRIVKPAQQADWGG